VNAALDKAMDTVIEVDGVVTRFGTQTVHDGLDLQVRRGELVALIGGSGSGKSVLLREILGLQRPTAGTVHLLGTDMWNSDDDTLAAVVTALSLAERVGCPFVNVLPGRFVPDRPEDEQLAHAAGLYRRLGALAEASGRAIVVEPINELDVPGYLTPTPAATAAFLAEIDDPNVRMLFDAYHRAQGGGDPVHDVQAYADRIGHVQYADAPGRGAPGTGTVPIAHFVAALAAAGYRGAVGL